MVGRSFHEPGSQEADDASGYRNRRDLFMEDQHSEDERDDRDLECGGGSSGGSEASGGGCHEEKGDAGSEGSEREQGQERGQHPVGVDDVGYAQRRCQDGRYALSAPGDGDGSVLLLEGAGEAEGEAVRDEGGDDHGDSDGFAVAFAQGGDGHENGSGDSYGDTNRDAF